MKRFPIFWKLSTAFFVISLLILAIDYLFRSVSGSGSDADLRFIVLFIFAVSASLFAAWVFTLRYIKNPIRKLTDNMQDLAEIGEGYNVEVDENTDFGSFATSFNLMASKLASSQEALKRNRDYLESVLDSTPDLIITVDPEGRILTANKGAEKALGYERSQLVGMQMEDLFENPQDRKSAIAKLHEKGIVSNYETRFVTSEGKIRDVLLTISKLVDAKGEIVSTIGMSKDVTGEKRLQKQLHQSQRYAAIGQVFTGVQHSMKNMLNACKGGSYMVNLGLKKDNRKLFEEGWEIVHGGIVSLTDMSLDMLKYVREWKPKLETVDIGRTLEDVDKLIKQTADDKGIEFRLDPPEDLPAIQCDPQMINSTVMDIVSNALDACQWKEYTDGDKPEVLLDAYAENPGENLIIRIRDNGIGMAEDVMANIFAPFFSTKSKTGTGLGLAITSRMIEVHEGRIDVDSEIDVGTEFRIVLPIDGPKS